MKSVQSGYETISSAVPEDLLDFFLLYFIFKGEVTFTPEVTWQYTKLTTMLLGLWGAHGCKTIYWDGSADQ